MTIYVVNVRDPRYIPRVLRTENKEQAESYYNSALNHCDKKYVEFSEQQLTGE